MTRDVIRLHGQRRHRANGPDPIPVLVHLKIVSDTTTVTTGDDKRRFVVTDDLGGTRLRSAHATVTTVSSSGVVTVQVHNLTNADDLLTTKTTIDANERTSYTAATPHALDTSGTPPTNRVSRGDVLRIDVDTAGTGAKGLEVLLEFGPPILKLTP